MTQRYSNSNGRDTSFTDDVRRRGLAAIQERLAARQGTADPTLRRQVLEGMSQPGASQYMRLPSGAGNPMYQQWAQSNQAPTSYAVQYGRTPEGDYAGFKNASDLKAAVQGHGETLRAQDRERAAAMRQMAEQYLGDISTQYEGAYDPSVPTVTDIARTQHMPSPGSPSEMAATMGVRDAEGNVSHPQGWDYDGATRRWLNSSGAVMGYGQSEDSPIMKDKGDLELAQQMAAANDAGAKWSAETADDRAYNDALNSWLADNADRYVQAMDTADLVDNAPGRDYWLQAGAEYGVDPNIVRGWYDEASMVQDFQQQRNLDALNQYGVTYDELQGFLGDQAQADEQAQQDALTGDEQAMTDYVQQFTGFDPNQLAQSADVNVPMLYDMVNTPEFQEATTAIINASANPDDVQSLLDGYMTQDPTMYRVLNSMFGDYGTTGA